MLIGPGNGFCITDSMVCPNHLSTVVQVKMQYFHLSDQICWAVKRIEAQISVICRVLVRDTDHPRIKAKDRLCLVSLYQLSQYFTDSPSQFLSRKFGDVGISAYRLNVILVSFTRQ